MGGMMEICVNFSFENKFGIPQIDLIVNDQLLYSGNAVHEHKVSCDLLPGSHVFKIVHKDKKINDYDQTHDKHVLIQSIKFDGIDLDQIAHCPLTHRGKFYPEYEPSYRNQLQTQGIMLPEYISPNHYLGHNGSWLLEFDYPVYDWIILEQKPSGINLEDTVFSTGQESLNTIKKFFNV